jgi:hypothetical protein
VAFSARLHSSFISFRRVSLVNLYDADEGYDHWSERGRAASVSKSNATGRPRRSVLSFAKRSMFFMKYQLMLLTAISIICLAGCQKSSKGIREDSSIPAGSFRLTVTEVLSSEDEHLASIKIDTHESQTYTVRSKHFLLNGGSSRSSKPAESFTDPDRQQAITILAYRHAIPEERLDYYKTVIKTEYGNTHSSSRFMLKSNTPSGVCRVTARDGIYPMLTPVVIGSLEGEDVLLTVGDRRLAGSHP